MLELNLLKQVVDLAGNPMKFKNPKAPEKPEVNLIVRDLVMESLNKNLYFEEILSTGERWKRIKFLTENPTLPIVELPEAVVNFVIHIMRQQPYHVMVIGNVLDAIEIVSGSITN